MTLDNKLGLTDSLELATMVMRRRLPSLSRLCFSASWLVRSLLFYILTQSTFAKSHAKIEHGIGQRI